MTYRISESDEMPSLAFASARRLADSSFFTPHHPSVEPATTSPSTHSEGTYSSSLSFNFIFHFYFMSLSNATKPLAVLQEMIQCFLSTSVIHWTHHYPSLEPLSPIQLEGISPTPEQHHRAAIILTINLPSLFFSSLHISSEFLFLPLHFSTFSPPTHLPPD